jgi:uncharacterized membrane protein YfcA
VSLAFDPYVALAALIVGFTVGLTGMGGGALMTPILVLLFGITPSAAVSSDLVAAMVMKPIGSGVHIRRRTVRWELVRWLCVGSIPAAASGVFIIRGLGNSERVEDTVKVMLGLTLMLAAGAMVTKAWLQGRRTAAMRASGALPSPTQPLRVHPIPTIGVGIVGGLLVGLTSVGSGSIIIVCMMLLYPSLRGAELVGTDLVQAVPLVTAAAVMHILFGDFELGLTTSILVGSIPGVYLGARMSAKAPDGVIRPALVFVLLASALKLLGMPTSLLGITLGVFAVIALPVWGAIDAAGHPEDQWQAAGLSRSTWVRAQALGAPFVVGFAAAIAYFARARPALEAVVVKSVRS